MVVGFQKRIRPLLERETVNTPAPDDCQEFSVNNAGNQQKNTKMHTKCDEVRRMAGCGAKRRRKKRDIFYSKGITAYGELNAIFVLGIVLGSSAFAQIFHPGVKGRLVLLCQHFFLDEYGGADADCDGDGVTGAGIDMKFLAVLQQIE